MTDLTRQITQKARTVRNTQARLDQQRAELDELILQGMDQGITWRTLTAISQLTQQTLNASRQRAQARREARPAEAPPVQPGS